MVVPHWVMLSETPRVTVLWRGIPQLGLSESQAEIRYPAVLESLSAVGFDVHHLSYLDSEADDARASLRGSDAVLVWADPISADGDREQLDDILRDLERQGTLVYSSPDTIMKMGTKDVLFDTQSLSWSHDTQRYDTYGDFVENFPHSLAEGRPRVLKQHRGNGGIGVWKIEALESGSTFDGPDNAWLRIQHAAPRDGTTEEIRLSDLNVRMRPYFEGSGHLINQSFAERVSEGMVRVYLVKKQVVGFARQYANSENDGERQRVPPERVFGIPAAKTMLDADNVEFAGLRRNLEQEWVPALQGLTGINDAHVPLLWDADFLFGPKDDAGHDTFLLCEINVSCVSPFPDAAPARLASALRAELAR